MSFELPVPRIDLPEQELGRRFDLLQKKLVGLWTAIQNFDDDGEQTIVVVPSLTVDYAALQGSLLQAYEERFLFLLLLLRQPQARLVYVTSQPIHPSTIDYYLGLLPGVIASHARERLFLVAAYDGAAQPLSLKLLQRPRLLARIRSLIPSIDRAHIVPFNTTPWERDLALRLGIPLFGADPRFLRFGSKSGCRRLFREVGLTHPLGAEDLHSMDDLVSAAVELKRRRPDLREAMVKHDEGVSGDGNAVVDLSGVDGSSRGAVEERLRSMRLEAKDLDVAGFLEKLSRQGGVLEERVAGVDLTSPSVQLRVTPVGDIQLLSTHDQLLGGEQGQKYLGCVFPAGKEYAAQIARESMKLGVRLASEGVLGRFAIDFVCARAGERWTPYAIELNLRKGGTTHPFLTLQFLTDGHYDAEAAEFVTSAGEPKYYVASDALASPLYRVFSPHDLFDLMVRHGLHYDQRKQAGVVLHMMTAIGDHGRVGITAIGGSREQALHLYERTRRALDQEAESATRHPPLASA